MYAKECDNRGRRIEEQDREITELKRRLARWESAPVVATLEVTADRAYLTPEVDLSECGMPVDTYELIARITEE